MQNDATRTALAGASSLLALAIAAPAAAQDSAANPTLQEVVVTGLRGSLQRNLDIKRDAMGVVDVISSEDIGKFPDSNVAASLQRIPGVSIQRNGYRGDPTGITVRGFADDFNETLVDGRRLSTGNGKRSIDFSTVGSDFVSRLSVLKTPDVTLSSSSIGATIDIEYPKPFDRTGMRLAASASGSRQDEAKKVTPTLGLLFSDTFADDTLGLLLDGIFTKRDTYTNHVFVSGWEGGSLAPCQLTPTCTDAQLNDSTTRNIVSWYQQQFGAEQGRTTDERIDGRIAVQWHPSDRLMLTIDDNYSRQNVRTLTYAFGVWFDFNAFRDVQLDKNGTIVNFINLDDVMNLDAGIENELLRTNQTGLNLKYEVNEHLSTDFDASYSKSQQNPDGRGGSDGADIGYGGTLGCDMGVRVLGKSSDTLPQMTTFGPNCNQARVLDPTLIGSHVLVRTQQQNADTLKQTRFMVSWKDENVRLDLGASYLDDTFELRTYNTFANNYWQAWAGYGPPSGRTSGVVLPASLQHGTIGTSGFIPGFSGAQALIPNLLIYNPREVYSYLGSLGNPQTQHIDGFNYGCCNYTGTLDLALDPGSIQKIQEKTWTAFVHGHFDTRIAAMPLHFDAGFRREHTGIVSAGVGQLPVLLTKNPADPTLLSTTFSDPQPISTSSDYAYLLPSMDMKLELTPKIHLRLDASRTLTRPAINYLTPVLNVGALPRVGALNANGGNPTLKPYLSDNLDFALEWYYQSNSYASVDFFVKNVSNFIVQGTRRQTINNVIDPTTGQPAIYTVAQRVNGPDAMVDGVELAWQHVFGNSGFGYNANVTLVSTNKPYDRTDLTQSGFAVTGLANSANFVGFYDKHGFEFRVAANWRDEYLLQFGQSQNLSAYGAEPTFANASLQIDVSTSYQLNEQFNLFFEALNLTNDTLSTHGRFDNQLLDVYAYGRRYTAGVRFRL